VGERGREREREGERGRERERERDINLKITIGCNIKYNFSGIFQIQFRSKRLNDYMFISKKGNVSSVKPPTFGVGRQDQV
jgi:hypothetical protein